VKHVKNGKNYDVGLMGFTLDDLDRLNVKVTNGPVTAIGMGVDLWVDRGTYPPTFLKWRGRPVVFVPLLFRG